MTARLLRDGALVAATAATCFVVLAPLGSASSARRVNVYVGNEANFVGMDWTCSYEPARSAKLPSGKRVAVPQTISCTRRSTEDGIRSSVDAQFLSVLRCKGLDPADLTSGRCSTVVRTRRDP